MKFIQKPAFKMLVIGVLALFLLIPAGLIQNLISERESTQEGAIEEMTGVWGREQKVVGPYLAIPFEQPVVQVSTDGRKTTELTRRILYVMPEVLDGTADVSPETRQLGIFEAVVYRSELDLKGHFVLPSFDRFGVEESRILWDEVSLNVGISDLRGVEGDFACLWNGTEQSLSSGLSTRDLFYSGVQVPVAIHDGPLTFELSTKLRGSQRLSVAPVGKQTTFALTSPWTEPNFEGDFAFTSYEPTNEGFTATWEVSHLNRNYPQAWLDRAHDPADYFFGTEFIKSVDTYSKTYRVVKYAILVIGLTFLIFFFSELMRGTHVNTLQYLLVGLALVLFYTLLLSFSEHIGFNSAYLVAALMTIGLEFLYARSVWQSSLLAGYIAGVLAFLYTFIFVLIQLKDFALLAGSLGLFVILAGIMYLSRKVDWERASGTAVGESLEA